MLTEFYGDIEVTQRRRLRISCSFDLKKYPTTQSREKVLLQYLRGDKVTGFELHDTLDEEDLQTDAVHDASELCRSDNS